MLTRRRWIIKSHNNNNKVQVLISILLLFEKLQFSASPLTTAAIPAHTPIAEDPLSPAQIQEAIRIYRSVLSASAPSSPVRRPAAPAPVERPQVHSNYYGGGPTDIPQSYLLNYATSSPARAQHVAAPSVPPPEPMFTEQQLIAQLEALQLQQQQQQIAEPVYDAPAVQQQQKAAPKKFLQKMYDDEESGYCFNRKNNDEEQEEVPEAHVATPTSAPQATYSAPPQQFNYSPAPVANNYSKVVCGPSEYIGMSNDNKFIYDAQNALPLSYTQNNSYTLVNAAPTAPIMTQQRFEDHDEQGMTTTEDVTQVPASPAVTSRFRGMIRNVQTPVQSTAPIVVERIAEPVNTTPSHNYNNYGAFMPVNQMSMESEYQLPVLNDLASCIEHY